MAKEKKNIEPVTVATDKKETRVRVGISRAKPPKICHFSNIIPIPFDCIRKMSICCYISCFIIIQLSSIVICCVYC